MTNEELCLRIQAGDAGAAEELISGNMGFIRSIALRCAHDYQTARMDADDYTQEGAAALLRAASQFDQSREVPFLTYAGQAVRNAKPRRPAAIPHGPSAPARNETPALTRRTRSSHRRPPTGCRSAGRGIPGRWPRRGCP